MSMTERYFRAPPCYSAYSWQKVYDPRTDTTAWSDNSALCLRDYLTAEYGFYDRALRVDDGYLQIAANECDEAVDGGKRYTTNGVIDAGTARKEVLRNMVTSCAGTLYVGGGYWKLRAGAYTPSVLNFGVEDLRGPISFKTRASISENFNKVQGKFNDAAQNYTTVDYPTITDAGFVAEDKGVETHTDLTLPFTTDVKTAQRIAKLALYRGRLQTVLSIEVSLKAMEVEVGDTISLTSPRYGFDAKEFEILGWRFSLKGNAPTIKLDLRETEANAYAGNATFSAIPANTPSLPRITAPLNGFAVSSGAKNDAQGVARTPYLLVNYTPNPTARALQITVRETSGGAIVHSQEHTDPQSGAATILNGIQSGVQYQVRARHVLQSTNGAWSNWLDVTAATVIVTADQLGAALRELVDDIEEGVIAGEARLDEIENNNASLIGFRAKAGAAAGVLELVAVNDAATGASSTALIDADSILIGGSVSQTHIANLAVGTLQIQDGAVTNIAAAEFYRDLTSTELVCASITLPTGIGNQLLIFASGHITGGSLTSTQRAYLSIRDTSAPPHRNYWVTQHTLRDYYTSFSTVQVVTTFQTPTTLHFIARCDSAAQIDGGIVMVEVKK